MVFPPNFLMGERSLKVWSPMESISSGRTPVSFKIWGSRVSSP